MHNTRKCGKSTLASIFVNTLITCTGAAFAMRIYAVISLISCVITTVTSSKTMAMANGKFQ